MRYDRRADLPDVINAAEVAEILRISKWSVYEMTRRGEIPHFSVGRCKRYLLPDVLALAQGKR
mgnify:CR=1 FL=1